MKLSVVLFLYSVLFSSVFLLFYTIIVSENVLNVLEIDDQRLSTPIRQSCPLIPKSFLPYVPLNHSDPLTDREKVLAMCKQTAPISLDSFFTETMKQTVTKIGDGAFADVYGCQKEGWEKLAIKVIPIEGNLKYNREDRQATFKSIQPEIVVSLELSSLGDEDRKNDKRVLHYSKNFVQVDRVSLCTGKYPKFLMDVWDDGDFNKEFNNDRPDVFPENQLYVLFSTENAGYPIGSYVYHSFEEFISIFQQISISLAVAEETLQFEHRDMHRGNVLVSRTHQEYMYFRLEGVGYSIKSYGVKATIVDYTLSRITQEGESCTSYLDLDKKSPWLFKPERRLPDGPVDKPNGPEGKSKGGPEGEPKGGEPKGGPEGEPKGGPESEPKGGPEGEPKGGFEGEPEGKPKGKQGKPEGEPKGEPKGEPEGKPEGKPGGKPEGGPEDEPKGEPEGGPEGEPKGGSVGVPEGEPEGKAEERYQPEGKAEGEPEGKAEERHRPEGEPEGKAEERPRPEGKAVKLEVIKPKEARLDKSKRLKSETYRKISYIIWSNWEGFYPRTNVLWLYYLATVASLRNDKVKMDFKLWTNKTNLYIPHILEHQVSKDVFLNVFSPEVVERISASAENS